MTYLAFKYVTKGLLAGDKEIPKEEEVTIALLGMAYNYIVNKCSVLNLMTLDKSAEIHRLGPGAHMIRTPELPEKNEDELEIDNDLCYVAASLVASYLSDSKVVIHQTRADNGIRDYNAKVIEIVESLKLQEDGQYDIQTNSPAR